MVPGELGYNQPHLSIFRWLEQGEMEDSSKFRETQERICRGSRVKTHGFTYAEYVSASATAGELPYEGLLDVVFGSRKGDPRETGEGGESRRV